MTEVETEQDAPKADAELNGAVCPLAGLRILRAARGLSLNKAAKLADMSPGYLQKLERCEIKNPSPHKLHQLAQVLHVEYGYLMELAGYPDPADTSQADTPPRNQDCVAILETAARSVDIDAAQAEILAGVAHELAAAKEAGVDIKHDLLPRVVRSLRELHEQGLEVNPLEEALSGVGPASPRATVTSR